MKKILGLVLLIPSLVIAGERGGVAEPNFEAGAGYSDSDSSRAIAINGAFTAPIEDFVGYRVSAQLGRSYGKDNYLDADRIGLGVGLFARKFDLGKAGITYSFSHDRFDAPVDLSVSSTGYRLFGAYYLGDFTLGFSRLATRSDDVENSHAWFADASVYVEQNTRLTLSGGGMDAADSYGLGIEHQPFFFAEEASLSVSYSRNPDWDSLSLGVDYFFGNAVSLMRRDREYR